LPILTFLLRIASGLKLIAEWAECQMPFQLRGPFTRCKARVQTSVPSVERGRSLSSINVTAASFFPSFHQHSHIQPHHLQFTSL
jgi:hypothetical protein